MDLGLALLSVLRKPGAELTLEDIAAWCDCEPSTIHRIETGALEKARWHPQNPAVRRAILAAMKKDTPRMAAKMTCKAPVLVSTARGKLSQPFANWPLSGPHRLTPAHLAP